MTKERDKKSGKDQILLEASRLGQYKQIESILSQFNTLKSKKKTNPLASLRKSVGPNSIRDPVTGFTCLHHAALNGHSECVKLMLDYGAKVNALDYKGSSALHLAAWAGNLEVVKTLLDYSATLASSSSSSLTSSKLTANTQDSPASTSNAATDHSTTTTTNSPNSQQQQIIDVNLCNNDNQTPISLAAQFGHQEVVYQLLEHGANVNIRNNQLESPLDLACLNGRLEIVDLLLKHSKNLRQDLKRPRSIIFISRDEVGGSGLCDANQTISGEQTTNGKENKQLFNSQQQNNSHVRRPSGSWASLLLGRRDSSSSSSSPSQQQPQLQSSSPLNQSPLHRLTVAGLSLRQKLSQEQDHDGTKTVKYPNLERRRSTLASGVALLQQQQQQQHQQKQLRDLKQMSVDGWFGDKDQTAAITAIATTGKLDDEQLKFREKLLDHSPLHYATRRGHLSVANLLLYTYEANLLQVSSLGSVLHEIALNNGKHSDMISLFYIYINNKQPEKRMEFLEQFLSLKNIQEKNVFQILNEINNRSAQEVKRLIYEYSEQLQRQPIQPSSKGIVSVDDSNNTVYPLNSYSNNATTNNKHYPNHNMNSQQTRDTSSQQQQQFGDIQHINSFVTMKRVPKNQRMKEKILEESTANKHLYQQQQQQQRNLVNQYAGFTQTIDRRRPVNNYSNNNNNNIQQSNFILPNSKPSFDAQLNQHGYLVSNNQQQLNYFHQNEAPSLPLMTRSVSNLNRAQVHHIFDGQQMADNNMIGDNKSPKNESLSSTLMWRQWLSRGMPASSLNEQNASNSMKVKSGRSKSRDLGSLFSASKQQQQQQQQQVNEETVMIQNHHHHYDNNGGNNDNLFDDGSQLGTQSVKSNHLVRSQTDCSHLMGRFFGEPGYVVSGKPAMLLNNNNNQQQQHQYQQLSTQQAIDRRMINRHYHVYEHEFYPPRLINPQDGKHSTIGGLINQPGQSTLNRCNQNNLRASVRSNQSNGCSNTNNIQDLNIGSLNSPSRCNQRDLVLRNNSRLSLNIDAQTRDLDLEDRQMVINQQQQQQQQKQYQQNPIDRFVNRHWKKTRDNASAQTQTSLTSEQKRHELVELQRKLIVGQQQQQQQQQQQLHNSYSLESHLSEPYLFESTRQALMQDFDQMIGEELLNKERKQPESVLLGSKQSILTGISLDMDRYGEHLTVSGTRIILPEKPIQDKQQQQQQQDYRSRLEMVGSQEEEVCEKKQGISPSSSIGGGSVSLGTQTSAADLVGAVSELGRTQPPPKPARPSLANRHSMKSGEQHNFDTTKAKSGVIYDVPTTAESKHNPPSNSTSLPAATVSQKLSSAKSLKAATPLTEPPRVPPPPPPPPTAASVMAHKVAAAAAAAGLTFDPKIEIDGSLTKQLTVLAPLTNDHNQSNIISQLSSNSHNSSSLDSGGTSSTTTTAEQFGLLKMASITSNSSSSNSSSSRSESISQNKLMVSQHQLNAANHPKDSDSGVCTSNSPASMSHDSEGATTTTGEGGEEISQVVFDNTSRKLHQNIDNNTSSSAVVRHLTRRSNPAANQLFDLSKNDQSEVGLIAIQSPPSPKTAQMCIEEALMPLTKTSKQIKMATVTTMTSPMMTPQANSETIDRWLNVVKQDDAESRGESDYENYQAIRIARNNNNFVDDISSKNDTNRLDHGYIISSEESNEGEDDDADYADSASLDENSSSSGSSNLANLELEKRENTISCENKLDRPNQHEQNQRKEITLKVVVDETETDKSGEEVFYINPLELKKISGSAKQKSQQSVTDAQTLTEEELCASIDKNSGYIRFTLRKRRNHTENDEVEETSRAKIPALNGNSVPQQIRDTKRADALCAAAKKTRFHLSYDRSSHEKESIGNFFSSRRHSELSSDNNKSIIDSKLNNSNNTLAMQNKLTLSSSQNEIVVKACSLYSTTPTSDFNNNNNAQMMKFMDKQAALDLKQWFSINLAGLIEYSQKFILNGFDNLQFLNHPLLLNEQLLKLIGIQEQSHCILILDRVCKELKEVDFEHLFKQLDMEEEHKLTTSKLLKTLQLNHLVSPDIDKIYDLSTSETVETLKEKYSLNLPLGYRIRLSSAIDFLLSKCLIPTKQLQQQQKQLSMEDLGHQQHINKQASVESNSSEVDMDVSQASSVTTTSSSSSKDSIKSIVQMKQQQQQQQQPPKQAPEEAVKIDQGEVDDSSQLETVSNDSSGTKKNIKEEEREELEENREIRDDSSMKAEMIEEQSMKVYEIKTTTAVSKVMNKIDDEDLTKPVFAVKATGKQGRTGSLVSEAARKLEAVAAQKKSGAFPIPVAAARRINNNSNSTNGSNIKLPFQAQTLANNDKVSLKEKNKFCLADKQLVEEDDKKFQQQQQPTVVRNTNAFVPVKSINWPPRRQAEGDSVASSCIDSRTIDKSSFEKHVENSNKSQKINQNTIEQHGQQEQVVKSRPKPALPAKPAKLAANRFIFDNNKS